MDIVFWKRAEAVALDLSWYYYGVFRYAVPCMLRLLEYGVLE